MKQHTSWNFSATSEDIDLDRILDEAPPECRVVEVVIGPHPRQRAVYIRRSAWDRAEKAGLHMDLRCCGVVSTQRTITPAHHFEYGPSELSGWVVATYHSAFASLEEIGEMLDAVDAHYARRLRVTVRAI